jgi:ribosomal protein S18 acetylase RimI-like enzyme
MMHQKSEARIIELAKSEAYLSELKGSSYLTSQYYDVLICGESRGWRIKLALKPLGRVLEKEYKGRLFEDHVEEARVFVAMLGEKRIDWIELGYDRWNNRMRVWEFLVDEGFRRKRIGSLLMNHAVKIARERGARMLVLETQTCDVPAIKFYLKFGFELNGFDVAAYSNEDVKRKEVRLEFGLKLQ